MTTAGEAIQDALVVQRWVDLRRLGSEGCEPAQAEVDRLTADGFGWWLEAICRKAGHGGA